MTLVLLASGTLQADEACPVSNRAITTPAPVNLSALLEKVHALPIEKPAELEKRLRKTFDTSIVQTKMEQFYRLLFDLTQHLKKDKKIELSLDPVTVRAILLESKVFTDRTIPAHITSVSVELATRSRPKYQIEFDQPQTHLPLNGGEGFYLFRNGKCQHAKKLIFEENFSTLLTEKSNGNLLAHDFKGVDLFGDFGNRGVVDVDIQYVELRSVEFYKKTNLGKVTAYVSREEFKKNKHNFLLRMITRIVPDRDVQPIDW
jgi:hypothetical protein